MSSRRNSQADACWCRHASTAIRRLNAKALLDDPTVSARAIISREQPSKATMVPLYIIIVLSRMVKARSGSILAQPRINDDPKT